MPTRLVLLLLVAILALGPAGAAPEDVAVGDVRALLPRDGAPLRERPATLAPAVVVLAHGTQVRVEERQGAWIRVVTVAGPATQTGWVRANQTVEPFALTQGGQRGTIAGADAGVSQADLQAAGRQFDPGTEATYRKEHPDLESAFPLVDRLEAADPDPAEVERFLLEGRLGRPEGGER